MIFFNGDEFEGEFKNNNRYKGIYKYKNGDVYDGEWMNDLKHNQGILMLKEGSQYSGSFNKGKKSG